MSDSPAVETKKSPQSESKKRKRSEKKKDVAASPSPVAAVKKEKKDKKKEKKVSSTEASPETSPKQKCKENESYCFHCRSIREFLNKNLEKTKNDRSRISGICSECKGKISKLVPSEKKEKQDVIGDGLADDTPIGVSEEKKESPKVSPQKEKRIVKKVKRN